MCNRHLSKFLGIGLLTLGVATAIFFFTLPDVSSLKNCLTAKMFKVPLCPGSANYVRLKDVAPVLRRAILVSEDAGFYQHEGIDFEGMQESLKENLKKLKFARGGSTITQQLVKNVYTHGEKTLLRKAREAVLAIRIEEAYSKDQIFERYLNVVQFGKNLFGVLPASKYYFNKSPSELNALEASFLAMLLPNPVKYSASFKQEKLTPFAKKRVLAITQRLARFGNITTLQALRARAAIDRFPWRGLDLDSLTPAEDTGIVTEEADLDAEIPRDDPSDSEEPLDAEASSESDL